jgi:hypothetical protein
MFIARNKVEMRRAGLIEPGMWVESDQGVGIVARERDGSMWLHLTDSEGSTLAHVPMAVCKNVCIARAKSIPKGRVDHLTDKQLAAFGYV